MLSKFTHFLTRAAICICIAGAPLSANADDVSDFSGPTPPPPDLATLLGTSFTVNSVTATGYISDTRGGTYSPANLLQRNSISDRGLGVCWTEEQSSCSDGQFGELDNSGKWELIALALPSGKEWVSVQLSSLDINGDFPGSPPERGYLYCGNSPTSGPWIKISDLTGIGIAEPPAIPITAECKSYPYLIFEPVNDKDEATGQTYRDNDFLVWTATTRTPVQQCPGVGTPGYWKNHPEAWPVTEFFIGGTKYTRDDAIAIMWSRNTSKVWTMFNALVSAKLNGILAGGACNCGGIATDVAAADAWMELYPYGTHVTGSSDAWKAGEPIYIDLDFYNNGGLACAPHRD